jgi:hypothetical protein
MYNIERYNFIVTKDTTNIISNDVTLFKGIDVYIQLDLETGHKFWFVRNNNTFEYELKGFFTNFKTKTLTIEWIEVIKDHRGNIISSKLKSHIENNTDFYKFFNTNASSIFFHAKQCINKIMYDEIKHTCFNNNGEFTPSS